MLAELGAQLAALEARIKALEARLMARHRTDPRSQLLATIPGVGPIGAVSFALKVPDARAFRSGRHFAAWLGITPREHSTAGRQRLGRISRQGDKGLRRLLVLGATAVIQQAKAGRAAPPVQARGRPWLMRLLARKSKKLAAVAPCSSQGQGWPTKRPASSGRCWSAARSIAGRRQSDPRPALALARTTARWRSVDPRIGTPRGTHWCADITRVFGTRSAKPIWACGRADRTHRPDI
jgi:transposase